MRPREPLVRRGFGAPSPRRKGGPPPPVGGRPRRGGGGAPAAGWVRAGGGGGARRGKGFDAKGPGGGGAPRPPVPRFLRGFKVGAPDRPEPAGFGDGRDEPWRVSTPRHGSLHDGVDD